MGYSNSGRFRYLVNSKGSGCYLWGIDKVQACNGKLEFSLGIRPCSFSMDTPFKEIDSVYVPYPAETRLIQQEYTVEREGETYLRLCMNLTYPVSSLGKNRWLKDWISSAVRHYIAPLANDTKKYNEECPWSDRELWFHWERQFLLSLQWKWGGGRYLTFYIANNGYYGGMHGIYTREYVSLDLQKKKVLAFDDLIKPEKRQYVRNILLAKMKADCCKGCESVTDAEYLLHLHSEPRRGRW